MKSPKVFCIGFQKTGTSSIGLALERLGYRVAGYAQFRDLAHQSGLDQETLAARGIEVAQNYDAAQDTPWPILYRDLDAAFPGSKFIHVVRDREAWIGSALKDFGDHSNEIHQVIYGCDRPMGNEETWLQRYDRHNAEVVAYFADRPQDFLSLKLEAGEIGWDRICGFLGAPDPGVPWPHANKRHVKRVKMLYWKLGDRLRNLFSIGAR